LVIQAFKYAAEPFFFKQSGNQDFHQLYGKKVMQLLFLFATWFIDLPISVKSDWLGPLFFEKSLAMEEGLFIVSYVLMAIYCWGFI